jgi:hypothetical protein
MLEAIIRNKINSEIRLSFKVSEDTLTSSIIGTLVLLPSKLFLQILSRSSYEQFICSDFGTLQTVEFWPRWNAESTSNSRHVEPDVFLSFENIDIIIEAKRYDYSQQNKIQWENEITAYHNELGEENGKQLIFLAIGGIQNRDTEKIKHVNIYKIEWARLQAEVDNMLSQLQKVEAFSKDICSQVRILELIKKSFELHGFLATKWFESLQVSDTITVPTCFNSWKPNQNYFFSRCKHRIIYQDIEPWTNWMKKA